MASIVSRNNLSPYRCRRNPSYEPSILMNKTKGARVARAPSPRRGRLPVVPATALGASDEEADHPEDQPDDEQNPEDLKRRSQQAATTEKQQQQDQDDHRNHP